MSDRRYCIGLDFGTKSGRALLVEVDSGREVATAVKAYPHDVMDEYLPDGRTKLESDWALQHPQDYMDVLGEVIQAVLLESGVKPEAVVGLGIDFTACTMLPTDAAGRPLCFYEAMKDNPHSYVKLWKHHAAQDEANSLNLLAMERNESFLARYGGKVSSEWMFPKIWQILDEAPEVYDAAKYFMEAADWIIMQLTGELRRNSCTAGYKAMWSKREGFPSKEFFKTLDPRLENVISDKFSGAIYPLGTKAGGLTAEAAKLTGLVQGTAVAVANLDAHAAVPASGITEPGKMLIIMGTSACHMLLDNEERIVPGMCGVVEDGIVPGLLGYEAGQSCCGDHFAWFVENCVPATYSEEALKRGINIHTLLEEKASALKVGESGLLALDWWNGNRSVLMDADLTGLLIGCTLLTKPEEIYRALIEATAFGTRIIIETFRQNGVAVKELYAAGGIAEKNRLMMQIYSDITGMEIRISASSQAAALGAAMFGAVAAGRDSGGYEDIGEAARYMAKVSEKPYRPIQANVEAYDRLYAEYRKLYNYFGRGENDVMKHLKEIRKNVKN